MFTSIKYKIVVPVLLIIAIIMSASSYMLYQQVKQDMDQKERTSVEVIRIAMENGITARNAAEEVMEREMAGQAVLASYIFANPASDYKLVMQLTERAGIDEIWITDDKGDVKVTNAGEQVDFNFAADPEGQAYEFMQLITGEQQMISQPAQPRTIDPAVYKYVGVGGWDSPSIVQVGRDGAKLTELEQEIGVIPLVANLHENISKDVVYSAVLAKDGTVSYATDSTFTTGRVFTDIVAEWADGKQTNAVRASINGISATLHLTELSNGQAFVVALSGQVLSTVLWTTLLATIFGVMMIAILVYFIVHKQFVKIKGVETAMNTISQGNGDLTQRISVQSADEMGALAGAFNTFVNKIQTIVYEAQRASRSSSAYSAQIREQADKTAAVSKEAALAVEEIATAASRQAEEVEDGLKIVHEMAGAIRDTEQQAQLLDQNNLLIRERQTHGTIAVETLEQSMSDYQERALRVSANLQQLIEAIAGIQDTARSIQDISAQTSLLALNASIEAARAGEQGRGFSVVAGEVRKLADASHQASEQIQHLVDNIAQSVNKTTSDMQSAESALHEQTNSVRHTSSAFHGIAEALDSMNQLIVDVRDMASSLSSSKERMVAFIETASTVTQQTAAGAQEVLAGVESQLHMIEQVADKANELDKMMTSLTVTVERFRTEK